MTGHPLNPAGQLLPRRGWALLRASMEAAMLNMSVANACIRGSLF